MQSILLLNSASDSFLNFPTGVTQQFPFPIEAIQTFHKLIVNYDSKNLKLQVWSLDLYIADKFRISHFLLHVPKKQKEKALLSPMKEHLAHCSRHPSTTIQVSQYLSLHFNIMLLNSFPVSIFWL
jgi:hypothetical protein